MLKLLDPEECRRYRRKLEKNTKMLITAAALRNEAFFHFSLYMTLCVCMSAFVISRDG